LSLFQKRLTKNSILIFLSSVVARGSLLIFYIFMARTIGKGLFGLYSFSYTYVALWGVLIDWGLSTIITKRIARERENSNLIFKSLLGPKSLISLAGLVLIVISLMFLKIDYPGKVLISLMALGIVLDTYLKFFCGVYRAFEQLGYEAALTIVQKLSFIALSIFFILKKLPIYSLGIAFLLSYILTNALSVYVLKKRYEIGLAIKAYQSSL